MCVYVFWRCLSCFDDCLPYVLTMIDHVFWWCLTMFVDDCLPCLFMIFDNVFWLCLTMCLDDCRPCCFDDFRPCLLIMFDHVCSYSCPYKNIGILTISTTVFLNRDFDTTTSSLPNRNVNYRSNLEIRSLKTCISAWSTKQQPENDHRTSSSVLPSRIKTLHLYREHIRKHMVNIYEKTRSTIVKRLPLSKNRQPHGQQSSNTLSNIIKQHGQQSSKHIVKHRQRAW
jgi:hypothetical protein